MITELEQKNGAIKRKHEIKHGVEAAVQHHSRCMNNIFQRTIYYLCMHRFDDDVMKPVELSHYSKNFIHVVIIFKKPLVLHAQHTKG